MSSATAPLQKKAWSCCSWLAKILSVLFASMVPITIIYIAYMAHNFWTTLDAYVVSQFQRPSTAELVLYEKGDFIDRPQLEKNLEYLLSSAANHYESLNPTTYQSHLISSRKERLKSRFAITLRSSQRQSVSWVHHLDMSIQEIYRH